jgi:signal transduction histidine kinase
MRNSIRTRLTVAFTGLAIGPLFLIGVILAWQSFITQQQQALNLQREVARRVAAEVTAFFRELENELCLVSKMHVWPGLDRNEQHSILKLLMFQDVFEDLALLDSKGQEQIHLSRLSLTFIERSNRAETDEFVIPHTSGQVYYSPVRFDEITGEPLMTVAVPLLNVRTGLVDGVLVSKIRLKRIWDLIADVRVSLGQSVYIVDAQDRVVAHRNPSVVLRGTSFDVPSQDGIQPGLTGSSVVLAVETARLGQQEFNIVAEQPVSEALALALNTVLITTTLIVTALVISGALGFLTVRQIVGPIQTMATTAQVISAGDLSQQVKVSSRDELGVLADAFNSMTAQLRILINDLEQRVAERTAQLEASNRELETFAYSVSHDLRAPLRHIVGFVRLLSQREAERLDATSLHYLDAVVESSDRMGWLIDDLLAFSRTGRAEMQVRRVELGEMIRKVRQELAPEAEGRHITWEIGPLPSVQADPILLRQVWVNLLSNAVKFTAPRPEARIEIGALSPDVESGHVTLFVRDNGVGFDPQYVHKLFGVFQRLHREEEFEGTGIGLATVRRIVERHGGRVWAEGDVDRGATFYLTLRQMGEE